jgi:hypothetical protein
MNDQSMGHTFKRICTRLALLGLIFAGIGACGILGPGRGNTSTLPPTPTATATPTPPPSLSPLPSAASNLDDDAAQWGIFFSGGTGIAHVTNVPTPSVDGNALQISLKSGKPYTGVLAYQNLSPDSIANTFDLELLFYFSDLASIQALEFSMNQLMNSERWEWAMQWQHIGDRSPQQGSPPNWRIWTGTRWQDSGVMQKLTAHVWYHFHLQGNIVDGQVHYLSFACDGPSRDLGQTFNPVSHNGTDNMAIGVQLDGNHNEDPYEVSIDVVSFQWSYSH